MRLLGYVLGLGSESNFVETSLGAEATEFELKFWKNWIILEPEY